MKLDDEATARAINAQPWDPLPGMVKLRCGDCHYWFAAPRPDTERCPDSEIRQRRRERKEDQQ